MIVLPCVGVLPVVSVPGHAVVKSIASDGRTPSRLVLSSRSPSPEPRIVSQFCVDIHDYKETDAHPARFRVKAGGTVLLELCESEKCGHRRSVRCRSLSVSGSGQVSIGWVSNARLDRMNAVLRNPSATVSAKYVQRRYKFDPCVRKFVDGHTRTSRT